MCLKSLVPPVHVLALLSVIEITIAAVMQLIRSQIMQCQVRPDVCGGGLSPSVISQTPLITPTHIRLGPQHFWGDIERGYGITVVAHRHRYRTSMPCMSEGNCKEKL